MARLLLPTVLMPALAGCDLYSCGNVPLTSATAPDGRHVATVFRRDCGATAEVSIQVSLLRPGGAPTEAGNLLVLDGEGPTPSLEWQGPDRLLIRYRRGGRVFRQVTERDGVSVIDRAGDA